MTGLVRKAALLSVGGLLLAASAMASIPSPANCTVPCAFSLVGSNSNLAFGPANTAADTVGQFSVTIRDAGNGPLQGVVVAVDFSGCCTDMRLENTQLFPGVTVNTVVNQAYATTDINGVATFRIMGAGTGGSALVGTLGAVGCAKIYAGATLITDGISRQVVGVSAFDLNGTVARGASGQDLSLWFGDFGAGGYKQRDDYDRRALCAATTTGADLSRWFFVFGKGGSGSTAANTGFDTTCP